MQGAIEPQTIGALVRMRGFVDRDRIFLVEADTGEASTYGQFERQASAVASMLQDVGMRPGASVAVLCEGNLALIAWAGILLAGCVEVPIHPGMSGGPLEHVLRTTGPAAVIAEEALAAKIAEAELATRPPVLIIDKNRVAAADSAAGPTQTETSASSAATILFTSGTSGPAKGAVLPHRQMLMVAEQVTQNAALQSDDVFYCVHPLNHVAGKYMCVLAAMLVGCRVILERRFDASVWLERVTRYQVTVTMAHGAMVEMIYSQARTSADNVASLTRVLCCPLPKGIGEDFERRFGLQAIEMWGMTEVGNPVWSPTPRVAGSCGRVLEDFYDLVIADPTTDEPLATGQVGQILVRPRRPFTTFLGYAGNADATVEAWKNLWFHTGDLAHKDVDGNIYYVDRLGDRIRRRAENISSYDIEAAASKFEGVLEVAAIGVPSEFENDEDIKLVLVQAPGAAIDHDALVAYLARRLPHSMLPRYIEITGQLPRTTTNKVRKSVLRAEGIKEDDWDRKASGLPTRALYAP